MQPPPSSAHAAPQQLHPLMWQAPGPGGGAPPAQRQTPPFGAPTGQAGVYQLGPGALQSTGGQLLLPLGGPVLQPPSWAGPAMPPSAVGHALGGTVGQHPYEGQQQQKQQQQHHHHPHRDCLHYQQYDHRHHHQQQQQQQQHMLQPQRQPQQASRRPDQPSTQHVVQAAQPPALQQNLQAQATQQPGSKPFWLEKLGRQVQDFAVRAAATPHEQRLRDGVFAALASAIPRELRLPAARAVLFGSGASGLALHSSDIDVLVAGTGAAGGNAMQPIASTWSGVLA